MRFTLLAALSACRSTAMRPVATLASVSSRISKVSDLMSTITHASDSLVALKASSDVMNGFLVEARNATDHISGDDEEILRSIIPLVEKTIYSSMDESHEADEKSLEDGVGAADTCTQHVTFRQSPEGDLGTLHMHVQDKQGDLDRLRGVADFRTATNYRRWDALYRHMQMISDAPACPDFPASNMHALDVYFEKSEYSVWYSAQQAAYEVVRDAFTDASSDLEASIRQFNIQKAVRDVQYCDWKVELVSACADFDTCFSEASDFYTNVLVPRVLSDMNDRQNVKKAGDVLMHQIRFFLAEVDTQQPPPIDTSRYEIAFPILPTKGTCDLSPLDDDEWVPTPTCDAALSPPVKAIEGLDIEGLTAAGLRLRRKLEVSYGSVALEYNRGIRLFSELQIQQTQLPPVLKLLGGNPGRKYVVIMTDPDAPSKHEPFFREFIHWAVTDVPLEYDMLVIQKGNAAVPYAGPAPPHRSDLHRYVILVYKQKGADPATSLATALGGRGGKRAALAAKDAGLGDPVAFGGFEAQWDESVDALHELLNFLPPPQYRSPNQVAANPILSAPADFIDGLDVEGLSGAALGSATLQITLDGTPYDYGAGEPLELTPAQAGNPPALKLTGGEAGKYVVIMTDPDAPSKELPLFREFIHWVVTDVPLENDALAPEKGNLAVPWVGFAPPFKSGLHRYIILVYKQGDADPAESLTAALGDRGGKRAALAATEAGLGDPIAYGFCVAQWDESVDALHDAIGFLPPPQYRSAQQVRSNPILSAPADLIVGLDVEGLSGAALSSATLQISLGGRQLSYSTGVPIELSPAQVGKPPACSLSGGEAGKYVVIVTDPDAPSRDLHLFREFIHWVVTDVPLEGTRLAAEKGKPAVPWVGLGPPYKSGLHRYIILVYKQGDADPTESLTVALGDRGGKRAALAAKEAGLGDPVAFGICEAQWDQSVDALHDSIGFLPPPQYRSPRQQVANAE